MTNREYQGVRDSLFESGLILEKSHNLTDTLVEMDMVYPFENGGITLDSITGETNKLVWKEMNKMAKKLSSKLSDRVHADDNEFSMHYSFKIAGKGKGEAVKYLPFTLEFDDGQILTALVKNIQNFKTFKMNKDMMVTHFMLNKQDITEAIYLHGDTSIDMALTASRLAKVIESSHTKFVSKNPVKAGTHKEAMALREEIGAMSVDLSGVVEGNSDKKEVMPKDKVATAMAQLEKAYNFRADEEEGYLLRDEDVIGWIMNSTGVSFEVAEAFYNEAYPKLKKAKKAEMNHGKQDPSDISPEDVKGIGDIVEPQQTKATLNFNSREEADEFAKQWSRKTLKGHTVGAKSVTVYDVTDEEKAWIDDYVSNANQAKKEDPTQITQKDLDELKEGFDNPPKIVKVEAPTYTVSLPSGTEKYISIIREEFKKDEKLSGVTYAFVIDGVVMDGIDKKTVMVAGGEKAIQTHMKKIIHFITIGADKIEGKNVNMPSVDLIRNAEFVKEKTGVDYTIDHHQHATFQTGREEFQIGDDGRGYSLLRPIGKHAGSSVKERWLMSDASRKRIIENINEELVKDKAKADEEAKRDSDIDKHVEKLQEYDKKYNNATEYSADGHTIKWDETDRNYTVLKGDKVYESGLLSSDIFDEDELASLPLEMDLKLKMLLERYLEVSNTDTPLLDKYEASKKEESKLDKIEKELDTIQEKEHFDDSEKIYKALSKDSLLKKSSEEETREFLKDDRFKNGASYKGVFVYHLGELDDKKQEEPKAPSIKASDIGSISKINDDEFLIKYSSSYSETPEADTLSKKEIREVYKGFNEEEFRFNVIPYLEGEEEDIMVEDVLGIVTKKKPLSIKAKLKIIKPFMSKSQYKVISTGMDKEDYEFNDVIDRLYKTITTMPKTYEQDGKGDKAVAYLHYFNSGSDWYITEKDMGDEQTQAFGYAILNGDKEMAELGYISIEELTRLGVELDFHYSTQTVGEIKGEGEEEVTKNTQPTDQELETKIKSNEVYKQVVKDSHGGVMYNVANIDKYDATEILSLWEKIQHKDSMDGIIRGAMSFLQDKDGMRKTTNERNKGYEEGSEDNFAINQFLEAVALEGYSDKFEKKLDEVVDLIEEKGLMDKYEDELNKLADQLTELMKSEN